MSGQIGAVSSFRLQVLSATGTRQLLLTWVVTTHQLAIRGWIPSKGVWEAWRLSETDTRMRSATGSFEDGAILFDGVSDPKGATTREALVLLDRNELRIEDLVADEAGDIVDARTITLTRVDE